MQRQLLRALLIASTCVCSWLGMMVVHEAGHVLHAWISGGTVQTVVLHPLAISRTDVEPNPHRHFVAWGGAIWGCLLPVLAWGLVHYKRLRFAYLFAFFAGFCLIANGAYLGIAPWFAVGDGRDLVYFGTPPWLLALFGICAVVSGFCIWNGLGEHFGLGKSQTDIDRNAALCVSLAAAMIVFVELMLANFG